MRRLLISIFAGLATLGCSPASTKLMDTPAYSGPEPRSISVADAGVLPDAIRFELLARGFVVPDDVEKADAVIHLSQANDDKGRPEAATLRLVSPSGDLMLALIWNNGWGGFSGSIADSEMHDDASEAAFDIVNAICKRIAPERMKKRDNRTGGYPSRH